MADQSVSWPTADHNERAVTDTEYEPLASAFGSEGFIGDPNTSPAPVYADGSGLYVWVRKSLRAVVRGHMWYSGVSDFTIPVTPNNSGADRWDLVVIGLNRATWDVNIYVKAGGASVPAVTRTIGTTGIYEIPVAKVLVRRGVKVINAADVDSVEYYVIPPAIAFKGNALDFIPGAQGRDIYDEQGNRWQWTPKGWRRVLTEDYVPPTSVKLVASWASSQGSAFALCSTSQQVKTFGSCWFTADPSRLYEVAIDCKIRSTSTISTPLEGVVNVYTNGNTLINSGLQKITKKNESRRLHFSTVAWLSGSQHIYAGAFKNYGDGVFEVVGYETTWLRVYDLGPQP